MARWTASCWLGSAVGYQDLEVQANTYTGAREQLQRIYGAQQIINLREVNERRSGDASDGGAVSAFGLIGLAIYIVVKFWPFFLAILGIYLVFKILT